MWPLPEHVILFGLNGAGMYCSKPPIFDNSMVRVVTLLQELMARCNILIKALGIWIIPDLGRLSVTNTSTSESIMPGTFALRLLYMFFAIRSKYWSTRKPAKNPKRSNDTNPITLPIFIFTFMASISKFVPE